MKTKEKKSAKKAVPVLTPPRGKELMRLAVNHIIEHPEEWDQSTWHTACGTKHCIGGTIQILGGRPMSSEKVVSDAVEMCHIGELDAQWLFAGSRRLGEIYAFAKSFIAGEETFDRGGFDRGGFDRYGFDRYGFDRGGFDRGGFDRGGFDRYGFDRYGFDRGGFDRDGARLPLL